MRQVAAGTSSPCGGIMSQSKHLGLVVAGLIAAPAFAVAASSNLSGTRVDNFMLADQTGMGHELYYYNATAAIVIVTSAQGDSVSNKASAALGKVRDSVKD